MTETRHPKLTAADGESTPDAGFTLEHLSVPSSRADAIGHCYVQIGPVRLGAEINIQGDVMIQNSVLITHRSLEARIGAAMRAQVLAEFERRFAEADTKAREQVGKSDTPAA